MRPAGEAWSVTMTMEAAATCGWKVTKAQARTGRTGRAVRRTEHNERGWRYPRSSSSPRWRSRRLPGRARRPRVFPVVLVINATWRAVDVFMPWLSVWQAGCESSRSPVESACHFGIPDERRSAHLMSQTTQTARGIDRRVIGVWRALHRWFRELPALLALLSLGASDGEIPFDADTDTTLHSLSRPR